MVNPDAAAPLHDSAIPALFLVPFRAPDHPLTPRVNQLDLYCRRGASLRTLYDPQTSSRLFTSTNATHACLRAPRIIHFYDVSTKSFDTFTPRETCELRLRAGRNIALGRILGAHGSWLLDAHSLAGTRDR